MANVSEKRPKIKDRDSALDVKRAYAAAYYQSHKEEVKARVRARYYAKREEHLRKYQEDRKAILEHQRKRREADPERFRAAQRARYAASPAGAIARANKRRGIKRAVAVGTDRAAYRVFVRTVYQAQHIACHWCERDVPPVERRIDHIVPLAKGGADDVSNLCLSCHACNASKGDKLPEEWRSEARGETYNIW
jgi:5-methylcytosine-specific restriction protein A